MHEKMRSRKASPEPLNFTARAIAHVQMACLLAPDQQWRGEVTNASVAHVVFAIECLGVRFRRSTIGRWLGDWGGVPAIGNYLLSPTIKEMIRTGLLVHQIERIPGTFVDHLIPAPVHALSICDGGTACGKLARGPLRLRLLSDLSLVDCLDCEAAIAHLRSPRL